MYLGAGFSALYAEETCWGEKDEEIEEVALLDFVVPIDLLRVLELFSSSLMMIELNTATSYFGSTSFTLYFICLHASFVSFSLSSSLFFHI